MNVEIGTPVFLIPSGNAARFHGGQMMVGEVAKVGRKYFEVNVGARTGYRFDISSGKYAPRACDDCNSSFALFLSEEELKKEQQRRADIAEIRRWTERREFHSISAETAAGILRLLKKGDKDGSK